MSWVGTLLSALIIALLLKAFILNSTIVEGISMMPNLHNGDKLISNKVVLFFIETARGDIVVFASPVAEGGDYMKRVIG
ncbi:signal peptidase I [Vagococcus acidifermentans]|uniref:Signal peptidase I n=1 Tax=Vagococcus acidifermentans TaxID=564710 RepID=A0A430AM09_9ENTE|nr:signal peptidase I [Vagococcus acidifermentans]